MLNSLLLASVLVAATPQAAPGPLDSVDPVDDVGGMDVRARPLRTGGVLAHVTPVDGMSDMDCDGPPAPPVVRRPAARGRVWVQETRCVKVYSGGRVRTTCKVVRSGYRDARPRPAPARSAPDDDVVVPPPAPGAPGADVSPPGRGSLPDWD